MRPVVAEDWAAGMSASLRAGLSSVDGSGASAALVSLVDLPDVTAEVVRRVVAAAAGADHLARATYDGRPGHPVLIGRDHWPGVLDRWAATRGPAPTSTATRSRSSSAVTSPPAGTWIAPRRRHPESDAVISTGTTRGATNRAPTWR